MKPFPFVASARRPVRAVRLALKSPEPSGSPLKGGCEVVAVALAGCASAAPTVELTGGKLVRTKAEAFTRAFVAQNDVGEDQVVLVECPDRSADAEPCRRPARSSRCRSPRLSHRCWPIRLHWRANRTALSLPTDAGLNAVVHWYACTAQPPLDGEPAEPACTTSATPSSTLDATPTDGADRRRSPTACNDADRAVRLNSAIRSGTFTAGRRRSTRSTMPDKCGRFSTRFGWPSHVPEPTYCGRRQRPFHIDCRRSSDHPSRRFACRRSTNPRREADDHASNDAPPTHVRRAAAAVRPVRCGWHDDADSIGHATLTTGS